MKEAFKEILWLTDWQKDQDLQTKLDEIEGYKDHNIDGGKLKLALLIMMMMMVMMALCQYETKAFKVFAYWISKQNKTKQ